MWVGGQSVKHVLLRWELVEETRSEARKEMMEELYVRTLLYMEEGVE